MSGGKSVDEAVFVGYICCRRRVRARRKRFRMCDVGQDVGIWWLRQQNGDFGCGGGFSLMLVSEPEENVVSV